MRIKTMGIDEVERYIPRLDGPGEACVSIHFADGDGWDNGREKARLSPHFMEVLRVGFDDCLHQDGRFHGSVELTQEQAFAIVAFVYAQHVKRRDVVIHCGAGMSRSVAVAAAFFERGLAEWVNPRPVINKRVYEIMTEMLKTGPVFMTDL